MVKQKVLFDLDRFNQINENISVYNELIKDVISVFSSVLTLGVHSSTSIMKLIKSIGNDCIDHLDDNCSNNSVSLPKLSTRADAKQHDSPNLVSNTYQVSNDIDLIRFTNSGLIFQISKDILNELNSSYIYKQSEVDCRTTDGCIYLDFPGNEACAYILLDYLNGKSVNFDTFEYEVQLEILDLFEFCELPLPAGLVICRERRDCKKKKYIRGDSVDLYINDELDSTITRYLRRNNIWYDFLNNYNNGYVDYDGKNESLSIHAKYEYMDYINQYIEYQSFDIDSAILSTINKDIFIKEINQLFGTEAKIDAEKLFRSFLDSSILDYSTDIQLQQWLQTDKKWKLLYRASENKFSATLFHRCCDDEKETVTLIKHIGHNNHINIFGGYTDQSWESPNDNSNCFIFTLSNEHNIPPTRYNYQKTIWKRSNSINPFNTITGPSFGSDIYISNNCHEESTSYCKASNYTVNQTNQKNSLFVNTDSPKSINYFIVEDYEVWRLCDDRDEISDHRFNNRNFINSNRNSSSPKFIPSIIDYNYNYNDDDNDYIYNNRRYNEYDGWNESSDGSPWSPES
ncbi:hypothetical protein WA158_006167 [Blastocystis sp. Blastoise]